MKVAIPSKGRIDFLAGKIFSGIPQDTYIFVNPSDYELYKNNNPLGFNIVSVEQEKDLTYTMEYINNYMQGKFVLVDDDVKDIFIRDGVTKGGYPKLRKLFPNEVKQFLYDSENLMDNYGLGLLCLREVQSNWYSHKSMELANVGYRVVFFNSDTIKKYGIHYDEGIKLNSDVDFYIQMACKGIRMAVNFNYAFSSESEKFDNSGGCSEFKTKEYTLRDCEKVYSKYNNKYVKIKLHPKFQRYGIVCNWKKLSPMDYWSKYEGSNTK